MFYLPGSGSWPVTYGGFPTSVWLPDTQTERVTAVDLDATHVFMTWSDFQNAGNGYTVESSTDGRDWSLVVGFENIKGSSIGVPRLADGAARMLLRVRPR